MLASSFDKMPAVARVFSVLMDMVILVVVTSLLTRRLLSFRTWESISLSSALVLITYMDTILYVVCAALLSRDFSLDANQGLCDAAIIICLTAVFAEKGFIYLWTAERVYVVRGSRIPRHRDGMYIFNVMLLAVPGIGMMIWTIFERFAYIDHEGKCVIGARTASIVSLVIFDALLNIYITISFVHPLRMLYCNNKTANPAFRRMGIRAFVGSCVSIVSSAGNLGVLAGLNGEYGWACLLSCHVDLLIDIIALHWASANPADLQEPSSLSLPGGQNPPPLPKPNGWAPDATWKTGGMSRNDVPTVICPDDLPDFDEMGTVGMGNAISHKAGPNIIFTASQAEQQRSHNAPFLTTECGRTRSRSNPEDMRFDGIMVQQEHKMIVEKRSQLSSLSTCQSTSFG